MLAELDNLRQFAATRDRKKSRYGSSICPENAEYQEARRLQAATEERIRKLEGGEAAHIATDEVKEKDVWGSGLLRYHQERWGGDTHECTIVGSGRLTYAHINSPVSPLGALQSLGKKKETFTFRTPNGKQTYTVEKVS